MKWTTQRVIEALRYARDGQYGYLNQADDEEWEPFRQAILKLKIVKAAEDRRRGVKKKP